MDTPHERLQVLRCERFSSRRLAAQALGIPHSTYNQYESGEREFTRHAERFARFFRVSLEWLLTGKGTRRGAPGGAIPVQGLVGAGGKVDTRLKEDMDGLPPNIEIPNMADLGAYRVKGDSQLPRFLDGDYLIFRTVPQPPSELVNEFALVETQDGRSLIKRLRYGRRDGMFNLESLNADLEENVAVDCAYEHVLTIPGRKGVTQLPALHSLRRRR